MSKPGAAKGVKNRASSSAASRVAVKGPTPAGRVIILDNEVGLALPGNANLVIRNVFGTPLYEGIAVHLDVSNPTNLVSQIIEGLGVGFTNANPWANIRLNEE